MVQSGLATLKLDGKDGCGRHKPGEPAMAWRDGAISDWRFLDNGGARIA